MSSSDSNNDRWVSLAAGVAVGAGLLALLYKMFFTGPKNDKSYNQQIGAPYKCTCDKNGRDVDVSYINRINNECYIFMGAQIKEKDEEEKALARAKAKMYALQRAKELGTGEEDLDNLEYLEYLKLRKKNYGTQTDPEKEVDWLPYLGGAGMIALALLALAPSIKRFLQRHGFILVEEGICKIDTCRRPGCPVKKSTQCEVTIDPCKLKN